MSRREALSKRLLRAVKIVLGGLEDVDIGKTFTSTETPSGVDVTVNNSLTLTAVFACIRILSSVLAYTPIHVYRRGDDTKMRADDHPLFWLLHHQPNNEMSAYDFKEMMQGSLVSWGNAYAQIIRRRGSGEPMALWPLRPERMELERRNGVLRYTYSPRHGSPLTLGPSDIWHIKDFTLDGIEGYSRIEAARMAIGLAVAAEEFGSRFYKNDARPGGYIQYPGMLKDQKAIDRLKKTWESNYGGENRHKTGILENGAEYKTIGLPPEHAQFLQTRKFQLSEIARMFNIPPHMLGDLERATYNNIEHQSIEFVRNTMLPWFKKWEQSIASQLMGPQESREYYVEFLTDALVRGDIKSRYEAYATARQWGFLSINDIRRRENMDPIPNGNDYLTPLNMVNAGEQPAPQQPTQQSSQRAAFFVEGVYPVDAEERAAADNQRQIQQNHRPILESVFSKVARKEEREITKGVRDYLGTRGPQEFDIWLKDYYEQLSPYMREQLEPVYRTFYANLGTGLAAQLNEFQFTAEQFDDFVREYIDVLIVRYAGSSQGQLSAVVRKAIEDGSPPEEAVLQRLSEWKRKRGPKTARNEATRFGNAVAREVYVRSGAIAIKWVTFGAENCQFCRAMNGKTVLASNGIFSPKGSPVAGEDGDILPVWNSVIRHPPLHQGCDCQIVRGA